METIVVYSAQQSSRLTYVLDWLLKERLQLNYRVTGNADELGETPSISLGKVVPGSISIPDCGLLWLKGSQLPEVKTGTWNDLHTLFAEGSGEFTLPFDLFSAIFFLLSRLEEYAPYRADKHGRYPAKESILYKKGWLSRPVADEWVAAFRKLLCAQYNIQIPVKPFVFQPTYDIDIAYSHLHKGPKRIAGAYIRSILKMNVAQITERTQVLRFKQKDPYDSFRWLRQIHKEYVYKPTYFVLSALRTTAFDKNIHPQHPAMMRVIKNLEKEGAIGIHPSYYSSADGVMNEEKKILESISGTEVHISRQHYIRFKMPDTYRMLQKNGITDDYSMGYGAHLGFRAGTGSSFLWYDVLQDSVTKLRIHPFCFMDTTAHFEQRLSVADAFGKLKAMCNILQKTNSTLVTVFHNFSVGTSREWRGWRQAYEHFLQERSVTNVRSTENVGK